MNEIRLLRDQLATERVHAGAVARACAAAHRNAPTPPAGAALEALREAATAHLALVLGSFDARDGALTALGTELPPGASLGREALETLRARAGASERWEACAALVTGAWDARRIAIESISARNSRVTDWRAFARIDADSIHRERALYERVRAALPAGLELE
jgi:hypothetical protein